jgi:hypothetical protein
MSKFLVVLLFVAAALSVQAQSGIRNFIRGSVVSFDDNALVVKIAVGKEIRILITDKTSISYSRLIRLSDIKVGDFVGSAAMPGPDGKLVAREVHLFPETRRGSGEGHYPWDESGSTMTNAAIFKIVKGANGQELTLQYKGGEKVIIVPEGAPVVTNERGDRSLLVPGSLIAVAVDSGPGGSLIARFIQATSKDGVKPVF